MGVCLQGPMRQASQSHRRQVATMHNEFLSAGSREPIQRDEGVQFADTSPCSSDSELNDLIT